MRRITLAVGCLSALLLACGGGRGESAAPEAAGAVPAAAGAPYNCRYFSLSLAPGWEAGPLTYGMVNVLPRGKVSPGLYFKFEGDGNAMGTAEDSIRAMIRDYGGSPMAETVIAGIAFKSTTYAFNGMVQTMHVAFRNGTKITITIEGAGGKDNPDIRAMLKSLALQAGPAAGGPA